MRAPGQPANIGSARNLVIAFRNIPARPWNVPLVHVERRHVGKAGQTDLAVHACVGTGPANVLVVVRVEPIEVIHIERIRDIEVCRVCPVHRDLVPGIARNIRSCRHCGYGPAPGNRRRQNHHQ
jgi:hypothetical protein